MENRFRRAGGFAAQIIPVVIALTLVFGGTALLVYQNAGFRSWVFNRKLHSMPCADYTSLAVDLYVQQRYDEAGKLVDFVLRYPEMPRQEAFAELRGKIDEDARKNKTLLRRGAAFLGGFLSGEGTATEARIGGLVANLLISRGALAEGDVPKRPKNDTDELFAALEGAHLGRGKIWFPSAMRILHRSDLISPAYAKFLLKIARESAEKGEAVPELQSAVASTQSLVTVMGFSSAFGVYKTVRNDEDIEQLTMWSRLCPDESYIVAMLGGMDLFSLIPDTAQGRALLTEIAKRGERGVRSALFWLK